MSYVAFKGCVGSDHDGYPTHKSIEGNPGFMIDGKEIMCDGDAFEYHNKPKGINHNGVAISTCSTFTIDGKPVVRIGDRISCGGSILEGLDGFDID